MNRDPAGGAALVTGAGSGIGRAIAIALAEIGHRLVLVGRRAELLDDTATAIRELGGTAAARPADVSDPAAVDALVASIGQNEGCSSPRMLRRSSLLRSGCHGRGDRPAYPPLHPVVTGPTG